MNDFSQRFYHAVYVPIRIIMGFSHPIVRVHGKENLPEGAAVLCCNHTAFSDAVWVILGAHPKRIFRTMAKKELFDHCLLGSFIRKLGAFPVDRNISDINAVKTAFGVLRSDDKLLIFPEGTRVRNREKSNPHNGAVMIAARAGAPIVPVYLTAKKRFWRKLDLVIGEPYHPKYEGRKPSPEELSALTEDMMDRIWQLEASL